MKRSDKIIRRLGHSRLLMVLLAVLVFLLDTKSSTIFLREYESFCNPFENTVYLSACENNVCQQAFVEETAIRTQQFIQAGGQTMSQRVFQLFDVLLLVIRFGQLLMFALILYQTRFLFGDPPSLIQLILRICDDEDGKRRLSTI
ncbi:MAG: hypothetical protein IJ468_04335 [Lachnospiraceae bacterium]|nr:hypothetical protein [Lachnospiraceae bacterium]